MIYFSYNDYMDYTENGEINEVIRVEENIAKYEAKNGAKTKYNTKNEIIKIEGKYLQISTTALSHKIYEDCNYIFPRIINDYDKRKNVFTIEGNCSLKMQYRPIRKVGV